MSEGEEDGRKNEEESKESIKKEAGETRGDIDQTITIDSMGEEEFQERR